MVTVTHFGLSYDYSPQPLTVTALLSLIRRSMRGMCLVMLPSAMFSFLNFKPSVRINESASSPIHFVFLQHFPPFIEHTAMLWSSTCVSDIAASASSGVPSINYFVHYHHLMLGTRNQNFYNKRINESSGLFLDHQLLVGSLCESLPSPKLASKFLQFKSGH